MKSILSAVLLVITFQLAFSQKSPIKFGDIPMEQMKMTVYPKDSSAAAVVLTDYGEAYISVTTVSATLVFERHTRIKILTKDGLGAADIEIPLYHVGTDEERLSGLKASTYNLENGKIVETKMPKDGVFKENYSRNINLTKFTLSNVREGSVIEYSYKINSEFLTNFPNWQFQGDIPVVHSEYWAIIPDFYIFQRYMQGYVAASTYEAKPQGGAQYQSVAHHWICKDVPAFKEEPYMTSKKDYVSKINFALSHINFPGQVSREIMGSWAKLNDDLLEDDNFGRIIKTSGFLKKEAEEITAGMTDPQQKMVAIYNHVRQSIEWDGTKDYLALSPKKVFELKKGSSGDINIALASMLDKAGIDVTLILLSTRDHGFIRKEYPMSKQFNYVVVAAKVGDKTVLLDATERMIPPGMLPERCLNGEGMIVSKTNHGWMKIETKTKAKTTISADLTLAANGEMKGKLHYTRDGYDALVMRKTYISKGEETYLKDFMNGKTWQVDKTAFENIKELDKNPLEIHELTLAEHVSVAGDMMYINPFVTSQQETNPFKLETREYPVDFGSASEKMYMCKIVLPDDYTVDEIPKSKILVLPGNGAKYVYNVALVGNTLNITSQFQINKSLFIQDEYPNLREFYNQIIAKQNEQIVLKKK